MTDDGQALVTYQGLHRRVTAWLTANNHTYTMKVHSTFTEKPQLHKMFGFRFSQRELLTQFLLQDISGCLEAPTRYGKCWSPDTPIMMHDGSVKTAADVQNNDLVMGHDSTPRRVTGCVVGRDVMYRITPNKGEPFVVTQDHILVLKRTNQSSEKQRDRVGGCHKSPNLDGQEICIKLCDYLKQSKSFKHLHKLVKRPVEFPTQPVPINPYCYGLWLGDGDTASPILTTMDWECAHAWKVEAARLGLQVRERTTNGNKAKRYHIVGGTVHTQHQDRVFNAVLDVVRQSTLGGHKRILPKYLVNDRATRLQLLAGLLDSDGYTNMGKVYAIIGKHRDLMLDIQRLCRGLGFRATLHTKVKRSQHGTAGTYYEVQISGAVDEIPVRLTRKRLRGLTGRCNPLTTGFQVELVGDGPYAGFEVEGPDRKILMGDFTVTHNTTLMVNILRAYPNVKTVITMPGKDLLKQCLADLKKKLPGRKIAGIWSGGPDRIQNDDITLVSMDSLDKCDFAGTRLVIIDEAHTAVTDSRGYKLHSFSNARRIAMSATLHGRFDKADILIEGICGPVLACRTFKEAVAEGAICMIAAVMVHYELDAKGYKDRANAYKYLVWENPRFIEFIRRLHAEVIPADFQSLIFIAQEGQADLVHAAICKDDPKGVVAMAKKLSNKEREAMFEVIGRGEVQRCVASKIYSTGVTFPDIRVATNIEGGGAYISCVQKPGRLAEIKPNKKYGILIDFMFKKPKPKTMHEARSLDGGKEGIDAVCSDSHRRMMVYMQKGYKMVHMDSDLDNLRHEFQKLV